MQLRIRDVAALLSVSEITIRRWLLDGKIPSYKFGHQYRFDRSEIESWMIGRKMPAQEEGLVLKDNLLSLYNAMDLGGILYNIPGKTKNEVFENVSSYISKIIKLNKNVIVELLQEREMLQPTAMTNGFAIPHARKFLIKDCKDLVITVFPEQAIEYDAPDGKPVHTLFFLFANEDKGHLSLLSKIARLCNQPEMLSLVRSQPNKRHLLEYIKSWEAN